MKQKTGPLHVLSLLVPCSWPWSCGRYVDAVCKPLSLWYFVTAVWAEKTDEKWNNQQSKLDTSQTSGNFCYAESWGIIRNVCLDVPFVVFQGCTAEKGCAGHSRGCWCSRSCSAAWRASPHREWLPWPCWVFVKWAQLRARRRPLGNLYLRVGEQINTHGPGVPILSSKCIRAVGVILEATEDIRIRSWQLL